MGEADKFIIVLGILPQPAQRNCHAVLQVPVQAGLGPVQLRKIPQELFGRAGQAQLLGQALEPLPTGEDFLPVRLVVKGDKHRCQMAVAHRNPQALGGDERGREGEDLPVEQVPPDF